MSIRLPLRRVLNVTTAENGAGVGGSSASTAGGIAHEFRVPQDTDNIVVKFTASIAGGGGVSAMFQTTDDGGTTYYDVARTSVISNAVAENAQWLSIPVVGIGLRSAVQGQNSVAGATNEAVALNSIGSAAASSLGQSEVTGLPVLSQTNRIFLQYTGTITSIIGETIEVMANSQSAGA